MNQSLQSYTPTAHPLNYDALATREGCDTDTGNAYFGALPFRTVCVFAHDPLNQAFSPPPKQSIQVGPAQTGVPGKQLTGWLARIDQADVRIGIIGANDSLSGLFPQVSTTAAVSVTLAFDSAGLLQLAIEKSPPGFVEIKWYKSTNPSINPGDVSFPGKAPVLINLGNLDPSAGVALYYVRDDFPFKLFGRFSEENYATEHVVMPGLRVDLAKIFSIRSIGNIVRLYALDDLGRDVTITSPSYAVRSTDKSALGVSLVSGIITQISTAAAVPSTIKSKMSVAFLRGYMVDATAETRTIPTEKTTLDISLEAGEMNLP